MFRRTLKEFGEDHCSSMAAALSYYTMFSLPPLLLLVLSTVGLFIDPADVQGRVGVELAQLLGAQTAREMEEFIRNVDLPGTGGPLVSTASLIGLLLGATGAFGELQGALNRAWEVGPDPEHGGFVVKIRKRILSLGMVATIAFLLLVSMLVSAMVSAFGDRVGSMLPGDVSGTVLQGLTSLASLAVTALLFAIIFRVMPDARIAWRDVAIGAVVTAVLFAAGKFVLGEYIARSDPGEVFGAAGSLAVLLVWIYYSAMIVLFGAEFTQVWASDRGSGIVPDRDAVRVVELTRHVVEPSGRGRPARTLTERGARR
jgi:membrane protein